MVAWGCGDIGAGEMAALHLITRICFYTPIYVIIARIYFYTPSMSSSFISWICCQSSAGKTEKAEDTKMGMGRPVGTISTLAGKQPTHERANPQNNKIQKHWEKIQGAHSEKIQGPTPHSLEKSQFALMNESRLGTTVRIKGSEMEIWLHISYVLLSFLCSSMESLDDLVFWHVLVCCELLHWSKH